MKGDLLENTNVKVIIPARNEANTIGDIIQQLKRIGVREIVVVDGHSSDDTPQISRSLGAKIIRQNGFGKGDALRQAFWDCLDSDIIVIMDADGSMDPEEIPLYIEAIKSGADVVKGSRFLPKGKSEDLTTLRWIGNKFLTGITNVLFLTKYTDLCYGYMAFKKDALGKLNPCLKGQNFEIETEICVKAKTLGLKVVEVPSFERVRIYGESKLRAVKDGVNILRAILLESFNENGGFS
jgi:glycosyltransferase involved in cell wall biosynthesis